VFNKQGDFDKAALLYFNIFLVKSEIKPLSITPYIFYHKNQVFGHIQLEKNTSFQTIFKSNYLPVKKANSHTNFVFHSYYKKMLNFPICKTWRKKKLFPQIF